MRVLGKLSRMRILLTTLAIALLAPSAEAIRPERPCFDLVLLGRLEEVTNVENLNDILPPPMDGEFYLGVRAVVRISVEAADPAVAANSVWVQAFFTDMPRTGSMLRFLLKQREENADWYRGVYWDWNTALTYDGSLPRCRAEFDIK
jgi:hypothetical protein